jgi:hypothetical protein
VTDYQHVKLYTDGGAPVDSERFVVGGEIPPFDKHPDVLLWGTRIFRFSHAEPDHLVYVEAFTYALIREAS